MLKFLSIGCIAATTIFAQTGMSPVDLANLREDVRGLSQRVGELSLRVEQLERENTELRSHAGAKEQYVTAMQLSQTVDELTRAIHSAVATSKNETLQQVAVQMEKLAKQTNDALDSLAKVQATRPTVQTTFSEDYPKEGTKYTVQKGDTLALIAKKTGARVQDIINANKLTDPSRIVAGQSLFIPNSQTGAAK
jgi:LysM repeat protein